MPRNKLARIYLMAALMVGIASTPVLAADSPAARAAPRNASFATALMAWPRCLTRPIWLARTRLIWPRH
jgi:hypothetical protein